MPGACIFRTLVLGGEATEQWGMKRVDLFVDLLMSIGDVLGYDFNKAHIKDAVYHPRAHGDLELEQAAIRRGFVSLLEGERALTVRLHGDGPGAEAIASAMSKENSTGEP